MSFLWRRSCWIIKYFLLNRGAVFEDGPAEVYFFQLLNQSNGDSAGDVSSTLPSFKHLYVKNTAKPLQKINKIL